MEQAHAPLHLFLSISDYIDLQLLQLDAIVNL